MKPHSYSGKRLVTSYVFSNSYSHPYLVQTIDKVQYIGSVLWDHNYVLFITTSVTSLQPGPALELGQKRAISGFSLSVMMY